MPLIEEIEIVKGITFNILGEHVEAGFIDTGGRRKVHVVGVYHDVSDAKKRLARKAFLECVKAAKGVRA